jgi:protocatechuate 3,4-dioxygenase, beta subunit
MNRRWLLLLPVLFAIVAVAKSTHSRAKFTPANEPGTPLVVNGRVYDHTGTKPLAGVKLYAYHTDAKGVYGKIPGFPRLKGTVVTDAQGRFQWDTIRPMPYPGGGNPAHIHIEASGGGYPKQWVEDLLFTDDPYLTAAQKEASAKKGQFAPIVTTKRDGRGVLHATFNIRMSNNPKR